MATISIIKEIKLNKKSQEKLIEILLSKPKPMKLSKNVKIVVE